MATRRRLVGAIGLCVAMPQVLYGQRADKIPRIGVLWHAGSAEEEGVFFKGLIQGFEKLGYADGRNVKFEHRFPNEKPELFASMAAELVALKVDILVGVGSTTSPYVKNASTTIPIVFAFAPDPVGAGLVHSLQRPGANVTGLSSSGVDLAGKRLQYLKNVVPRLSRVAILGIAKSKVSQMYVEEAERAAATLGMVIQSFEISSVTDLDSAFEQMTKARMQALGTTSGVLLYAGRERIAKLALMHRLPACGNFKESAEAGTLMSYGPDLVAIVRRVAVYADRILKGEKPAEMAVEQPSVFDFFINLRTARTLNINVPQQVLLQATKVIE